MSFPNRVESTPPEYFHHGIDPRTFPLAGHHSVVAGIAALRLPNATHRVPSDNSKEKEIGR